MNPLLNALHSTKQPGSSTKQLLGWKRTLDPNTQGSKKNYPQLAGQFKYIPKSINKCAIWNDINEWILYYINITISTAESTGHLKAGRRLEFIWVITYAEGFRASLQPRKSEKCWRGELWATRTGSNFFSFRTFSKEIFKTRSCLSWVLFSLGFAMILVFFIFCLEDLGTLQKNMFPNMIQHA